jgi:PAS domain S-box-containing protein
MYFLERIGRVRDGKAVSTNVEYRIKRKDGTLKWIYLNVNPVVKANERLSASVVTTDISERKKLEEALRIKDLAVASSNHGIGIGSLEGENRLFE